MTDLLLQAEGLTKSFRKGRTSRLAISDISFSIAPNTILGLVGESGSGKSTTVRCLLGLERPDSGTVTYDGHELTAGDQAAWRRFHDDIGMVFQDPYSSLNPRMTVERIICEPLVGRTAPRDLRERCVEMLELVGLSADHLGRHPRSFSGGQRQRIAIARALIARPRLLICDEPVSALDVSIQAQVLNLLKSMQETLGLTVLFIAHNLAVVRYMCDHIVVLEKGRVAEQGSREAIFEAPATDYTRSLLEAVPRTDPELERARRAARRNTLSTSRSSS
ncbi:ATP-binding cassette domain-containing protein [Novosphingobium pentaromativorans]|uniref:ABC transporter related protein n=1 Tax=Novosphingobium pentaromativorans US6-1 TaxID=1088721 RepID=G6EA85_9SPHN|nr:ATP-binding cassette domain-containing protein [Novosphingobium pentaromativorans]AIT80776.1 peptide ABC transporter ATPase [Novosphingobium pentaromativorans US6-1]EHJ61800.1 ABC transporter related protein [Novosphingobium pentaromativorans US6-1]